MNINIKDLHFRQGSFTLNCEDLCIPQGKMTALLGPSGSGKSTLLRLIAGFHPLQQGQIFLGDRDISQLAPYKRDLGFLFQDLALFPHMNAGDNIRFGLKMKQYAKEKQDKIVAEMLALIDLKGFDTRRCQELSGGERQRVALARALAPNPECLLLDEPLSALDAAVRTRLGQEIRQIQQKRHLTTVLVTHDQQEALNLSDWIVLMKEGRIIETGSPQDLYNRPQNEWTATFLGTGILLDIDKSDGKKLHTPLGTFPRNEDSIPRKLLIRPEWLSLEKEGIPAEVLQCEFGHGAYILNLAIKDLKLNMLSREYHNPGEKLAVKIHRIHPMGAE